MQFIFFFFFFSSRRRHTRCSRDWSSDVCSSDLRKACCIIRGQPLLQQPSRNPDRSQPEDVMPDRAPPPPPPPPVPPAPPPPPSEKPTAELPARPQLLCPLLP